MDQGVVANPGVDKHHLHGAYNRNMQDDAFKVEIDKACAPSRATDWSVLVIISTELGLSQLRQILDCVVNKAKNSPAGRIRGLWSLEQSPTGWLSFPSSGRNVA